MTTMKLLHCYDIMSKPARLLSFIELMRIILTVKGALDYEIMTFRASRPRVIRTV